MSQQPWRQKHVPPNITTDNDNDIPLVDTAPPLTSPRRNELDDGEASLLKRRISSDHDFHFDAEMADRRTPMYRPTDGRSKQPLLPKDDLERGRTPPTAGPAPSLLTRRSTLRSRSPDTQAKLAAKQKYTYAAFFLVLSLISFVVQTETAVYIQHTLKWNKAFCML